MSLFKDPPTEWRDEEVKRMHLFADDLDELAKKIRHIANNPTTNTQVDLSLTMARRVITFLVNEYL